MVMPVLGGLMVVFLPFIGLYLTAKTVVGGVTGAFSRSAQDLAATVTPDGAPGAVISRRLVSVLLDVELRDGTQ